MDSLFDSVTTVSVDGLGKKKTINIFFMFFLVTLEVLFLRDTSSQVTQIVLFNRMFGGIDGYQIQKGGPEGGHLVCHQYNPPCVVLK